MCAPDLNGEMGRVQIVASEKQVGNGFLNFCFVNGIQSLRIDQIVQEYWQHAINRLPVVCNQSLSAIIG